MPNPSMQSRYRATLLGALCGDATGARYEWQASMQIVHDSSWLLEGQAPESYSLLDYHCPWAAKKGRVKLVAKGHPTDDSELTAALAQSLVNWTALMPATSTTSCKISSSIVILFWPTRHTAPAVRCVQP